jgi:hypothetical protein
MQVIKSDNAAQQPVTVRPKIAELHEVELANYFLNSSLPPFLED